MHFTPYKLYIRDSFYPHAIRMLNCPWNIFCTTIFFSFFLPFFSILQYLIYLFSKLNGHWAQRISLLINAVHEYMIINLNLKLINSIHYKSYVQQRMTSPHSTVRVSTVIVSAVIAHRLSVIGIGGKKQYRGIPTKNRDTYRTVGPLYCCLPTGQWGCCYIFLPLDGAIELLIKVKRI